MLELNYFGKPLSDAWYPLRPHPKQHAAYHGSERFIGLDCGRGSGKTEIARRRIIRWLPVKKPWVDPMYFYALPTYNQARRVAWKPILNLLPKSWVSKVRESDLTIETTFGSTLIVVGMDKPQRIEGSQYDGGVVDESCDQKPGTFDRTIMPALTHRNGWCMRIGVPKRYGVGAAEFKKFCMLGRDGKDPDTVAYTWPSSDILTPDELAAAERLLDPRDFNEQFCASWEDIGGAIYWAFGDHNISSVDYDPFREIVVGSDFNVDPMCWVLGHVKHGELFIFDELYLRNSNTRATLDELHSRYPGHESGWVFMGDASARARKTSAAFSDYMQIKNDTRFRKKQVKYFAANPRLVDRYASCNALFKNAAGDVRCHIDSDCKKLIADLEARLYKEGTRDPDDSDPTVGHISDALGYPIHALFPIKIDQPSFQVVIAS